MKNDFFKHILLSGGSKQNRAEIENENLPVTFSGNGHRLRNYRIYGNTGGVGDLQANGKYLVPVTVSGKNLLKNTAISQTINGVTFTVHSDKSVTANGTATDLATLPIPIVLEAGNYILSGCPLGGGTNRYRLDTMRDAAPWGVVGDVDYGSGAVSQFEERMGLVVRVRIANGYTCDNLTFYPMIRTADITATDYEPYHEPQTVNIYLDEQLNENDYIDFYQQKRYPSGDMISLPAIPTIDGTNILSVATETQPSKIYLQGNITEIETVSAQALQANIQSLQPLSLDDENLELDVMPIDKSEIQTDYISETPVENTDESEIENLETTGDDENAE